MQIRDLEGQIKELEAYRRLQTERMARHIALLTVERVADELLKVLRRDSPERDSPEDRVLLGDLTAEIESRHEYWPE